MPRWPTWRASSGLGGLALARVIDQLDDGELGVVAVAPPELDDARVAARPILVALAQLVEETLQRGDARRARRARLLAPAASPAPAARVARVEEAGGLPAQVQRLRGRVVAFEVRARLRESVMTRSTKGRSSFAFGSVVTMRSSRALMSEVARLRSIDIAVLARPSRVSGVRLSVA